MVSGAGRSVIANDDQLLRPARTQKLPSLVSPDGTFTFRRLRHGLSTKYVDAEVRVGTRWLLPK